MMHELKETQPLVITRKGRGIEEVEGDRAGLRALQTPPRVKAKYARPVVLASS
jgi:hypothetical protein